MLSTGQNVPKFPQLKVLYEWAHLRLEWPHQP